MLHVGLTGNIASGKTYAGSVFSLLGAHVIDADQVVHDLLAPGTGTYINIIKAFGEQILNANREIDRRKLGRIVFSDPEKRAALNALTHPEVRTEILRRISDLEKSFSNGIIIVDAALMVETGGYKAYDCLIVVKCDPALQISRLMNRDGFTEAEARSRMSSQMPIEEKVRLADYTINTSGTLKQTQAQVEAIYEELLVRERKMKERKQD